MLVCRVRINHRLMRRKYGSGLFSSLTRFITNSARKIANSSSLKKALSTATLAKNVGINALKTASKNPEVRKTITNVVEHNTNQLLDSIVEKVKDKVPLSSQHLVDKAGVKAKKIVKNKANEILKNTPTTTKNKNTIKKTQKRKKQDIRNSVVIKKPRVDFGDPKLNKIIK